MKTNIKSLQKKRGSSISRISELPENTLDVGCGRLCRVDYLSTSGKWIHMSKLLALVLVPLFGGWGITIYSLADNAQLRQETMIAQDVMTKAISLGRLIHRLQNERDMGILYISKIGPGTKAFLIDEYDKTDLVFTSMWTWPLEFSTHELKYFRTKNKLITHINQHRTQLDTDISKLYGEIKFYSDIVDFFMDWMVDNIKESGFGNIWKSLVVFQKLTRCMLDTGAERAYGAMFYAQGNFPDPNFYSFYFRRIHRFNNNYRSASYYSNLVDPLIEETTNQQNITAAIRAFRNEIKYSNVSGTYTSSAKAESYFDNITFRIDYMFLLQETVATKVNGLINTTITEYSTTVIILSVTAVTVILACPAIFFFSSSLTTNIQNYSRTLVKASNDLDKQKNRSTSLLYQMLPKAIVEQLQRNSKIESEYFKSATVMFTSIVNFTQMSIKFTPLEVVELLNTLYTSIDGRIEQYDVYKVETINDTYMVVSGVPIPNGDRHASEIAYLGLDIVHMVKQSAFTPKISIPIHLLLGISTGSVSAGIVGTVMLRYCLFGDTVNTASRMRSNSTPNRIQVSESTYSNLNKTGLFKLKSRGVIEVKGKGKMNTHWLLDFKVGLDANTTQEQWRLPGEMESIQESDSVYSLDEDTRTKGKIFAKGMPKSTPGTMAHRKKSIILLDQALPLDKETAMEEMWG